MKKKYYFICFIFLFIATVGCSSDTRHHKTSLPDPASFNAHFGDIDVDSDDWVCWDEFKLYFPKATSDIFNTLDINEDNKLDHDEWHEFKQAHGLKKHN
jgi:hypothetical protein